MSDPTSIKTQSDAAEPVLARAYIYRLLADLLRHPRTEGIQKKLSEHRDRYKLAIKALPYSGGPFMKIADALFRKISTNDLSVWVDQFEQLFGHTANSKIPIYELEYGEEHSHRQPQQLADIAAFYQAFGVTVDASKGERIDHAAVELEFMFYLSLKEEHALINEKSEEKQSICRQAEQHFFDEHIGRWMPAFFGRLSKQGSKNSVLTSVAQLGHEFFLAEAVFLGSSIGTKDLPIRNVEEQVEAGCVSCVMAPKAVPS